VKRVIYQIMRNVLEPTFPLPLTSINIFTASAER
jgi:hypothetical protein